MIEDRVYKRVINGQFFMIRSKVVFAVIFKMALIFGFYFGQNISTTQSVNHRIKDICPCCYKSNLSKIDSCGYQVMLH